MVTSRLYEYSWDAQNRSSIGPPSLFYSCSRFTGSVFILSRVSWYYNFLFGFWNTRNASDTISGQRKLTDEVRLDSGIFLIYERSIWLMVGRMISKRPMNPSEGLWRLIARQLSREFVGRRLERMDESKWSSIYQFRTKWRKLNIWKQETQVSEGGWDIYQVEIVTPRSTLCVPRARDL